MDIVPKNIASPLAMSLYSCRQRNVALHFNHIGSPDYAELIAKRCNLGTVLAFMPVVHVHEQIIQSILQPVPGKRSGLTKRFGGNVD